MEPRLSFLTVITDPEYLNAKYNEAYFKSYEGELSYGNTKVKVTYHTEEYEKLGYRDQSVVSDFSKILSHFESVGKGLEAYKITLENRYEENIRKTYQAYAKFYGISDCALLIQKKSFDLSKDSLKAMVDSVNNYTRSAFSHARLAISTALQNQENEILGCIPLEIKSDPMTLGNYLKDELAKKGFLYEQAVAQFKELKGQAAEGSYVLCKLIAQCDAWKVFKSKKGCENLPFDAVWRCCIDGDCEKYGAYYFENEPFYILAMLRGLGRTLNENILNLWNQPLTQQDYENFSARLLLDPPIHKNDNAIKGSMVADQVHFRAKMSDRRQNFDTRQWIKDEIGIQDLKDRTEIQSEMHKKTQSAEVSDKDYWIANTTGFEYKHENIWHLCRTTPTIISDRIFLGLHQMVHEAKSPGERLIAYIWAARELEICHLFGDGNGRMAIVALINWIFADPDLSLYIPEDPNILDMQAPEKLICDIHSGMVRAAELSGKQRDAIIPVEELIRQAGVKGQSWNVVHKRAELSEEVIKTLVEKDKKRPVLK